MAGLVLLLDSLDSFPISQKWMHGFWTNLCKGWPFFKQILIIFCKILRNFISKYSRHLFFRNSGHFCCIFQVILFAKFWSSLFKDNFWSSYFKENFWLPFYEKVKALFAKFWSSFFANLLLSSIMVIFNFANFWSSNFLVILNFANFWPSFFSKFYLIFCKILVIFFCKIQVMFFLQYSGHVWQHSGFPFYSLLLDIWSKD